MDLLDILPDSRVNAYEIKAGKTYNADYFKNLRYLHTLIGSRMAKSMVVYDGDQESFKDIDGYCNFRNLKM